MTGGLSSRNSITDEPRRTPYGARVHFLLGDDVNIGLDGPISLIGTEDVIVGIKLASEQPHGRFSQFKRYTAEVFGFASAAEAEEWGLNVAMALLWAAVSKRFTLHLDYSTAVPVTVFDRTAGDGGLRVGGHVSVLWRLNPSNLAEFVEPVLRKGAPLDKDLLLSLELFAGAWLELTLKARFIAMVSALEPLAVQRPLPQEVIDMSDEVVRKIPSLVFSGLGAEDAQRLRDSLAGRVRQLQRESVRQAILRLVRELLPGDAHAVWVIDGAYNLRSKILHEGVNEPYLDKHLIDVESVIRRLYEARIGLTLATAAV